MVEVDEPLVFDPLEHLQAFPARSPGARAGQRQRYREAMIRLDIPAGTVVEEESFPLEVSEMGQFLGWQTLGLLLSVAKRRKVFEP